MSGTWRRRGRGGEHGAPVELRFVDMFMAAIGALIFMAMLLALVMKELGAKEAMSKVQQVRIFASMEPTDGKPETTNAICGHYTLSIELQGPQLQSPLLFRPLNPRGANEINPRFIFCGNSLDQDENCENPFALLLVQEPAKGRHNFSIILNLHPNTPPITQTNLTTRIRVLVKQYGAGENAPLLDMVTDPKSLDEWFKRITKTIFTNSFLISD